MQWSASLTREADIVAAVSELANSACAELGRTPDLAFVFASNHYRPDFARLSKLLSERLPTARLIGCSATGVIGCGSEVEQQRAMSLTAAVLPDVVIDCWHLEADGLRPGSAHSNHCAELAQTQTRPAQFIVLADPFSFPTPQLLRSLEGAFRPSVIVGGLASGGQAAGEIALFLNQQTYYSGATVVALSGNIETLTAVAQGCRPIGEPMFASAQSNKISALDGRPAMEILSTLFEAASAQDQQLMQHSLFVGLAMQAGGSHYEQGDFLIRNMTGADKQSGAIWLGADVVDKQIVQFHLRDAETSAQDLERNLARFAKAHAAHPASGGLLFSCIGRGVGLYGRADHDSDAFFQAIGQVPLGGFFCNGEIGPVAGATFVHAYTSAFAVFRENPDFAREPPPNN